MLCVCRMCLKKVLFWKGKSVLFAVFPREREVDWKMEIPLSLAWNIVFPREREVDWKVLSGCSHSGMTVFPREREVDWKVLPISASYLLFCLPSWEGSGLKGIWITRLLSGWMVFPREREVDWKFFRASPLCQAAGVFPREREVDWKTWTQSSLRTGTVFPREREVDWKRAAGGGRERDPGLPSWEGSGLKGVYVFRLPDSDRVFPREREVDWKAARKTRLKEQIGLPSWEGSGLKDLQH